MLPPPDVPPEAAAFLQEMGYLEPERLEAGDLAPVLTLSALHDGEPVRVGAPDAAHPTVLVFGSYT